MLIKDSKSILVQAEGYEHRAVVPMDDGKPVTFKWHWPRGTFDRRMSAYEIAEFILPHMRAILGMGILADHPRIVQEFGIMYRLLESPVLVDAELAKLAQKSLIDKILPWIKPVVGDGPDDIIEMSISKPLTPQPNAPSYCYGGQTCRS